MFDFDRVSYLRWVRGLAARRPAKIPLTFSGMLEPDVDWLGAITPRELVAYDGSDHVALAGRLAEEWGVAREQVLLMPGTHGSILHCVLQRMSEVDGPVVVEDPTYEPLWRIPEGLGIEVLRWPRPRNRDFGLDPAVLEDLVARKPAAFLFSHPHNPSGAVFTAADRALLEEFHERTGALLVSDEVYLEFEPDPDRATLLGMVDDLLILRSFTKVFGLGPIRCTAVAGAAGRIAALARLSDYTHTHLPAPTRAVAEKVWDHREELWARARAASAAGRVEVEAFLGRAEGLVEAYLPGSGIICFPRLTDSAHAAAIALARRRGASVDPDSLPGVEPAAALWIEALARESGIQLTPGEFFGDGQAFRMGFGIDPQLVRTGLQGIEAWLRRALEEA
jgi:aspartate/methionine/tyrosine aminotransferase